MFSKNQFTLCDKLQSLYQKIQTIHNKVMIQIPILTVECSNAVQSKFNHNQIKHQKNSFIEMTYQRNIYRKNMEIKIVKSIQELLIKIGTLGSKQRIDILNENKKMFKSIIENAYAIVNYTKRLYMHKDSINNKTQLSIQDRIILYLDKLQQLYNSETQKQKTQKITTIHTHNPKYQFEKTTRPSSTHPSTINRYSKHETQNKYINAVKIHVKHNSEFSSSNMKQWMRCRTAQIKSRCTINQQIQENWKVCQKQAPFSQKSIHLIPKTAQKGIKILQKKSILKKGKNLQNLPNTNLPNTNQIQKQKKVTYQIKHSTPQSQINIQQNNQKKRSPSKYIQKSSSKPSINIRNSQNSTARRNTINLKQRSKSKKSQQSSFTNNKSNIKSQRKLTKFTKQTKKNDIIKSDLRKSNATSQKRKRTAIVTHKSSFNQDNSQAVQLKSEKFIKKSYIKKNNRKFRKKNKIRFASAQLDNQQSQNNDKVDLQAIRQSINKTFYLKYHDLGQLSDPLKLTTCSQMMIAHQQDNYSYRLNKSEACIRQKFHKNSRKVKTYQNPRNICYFGHRSHQKKFNTKKDCMKELKQFSNQLRIFRRMKAPQTHQQSMFFKQEDMIKRKQNQKLQRYLNFKKLQTSQYNSFILKQESINCKKDYILQIERRLVFENDNRILLGNNAKKTTHLLHQQDISNKLVNYDFD